MFLEKKVLAVIPARGGSKGLPGKNIRPFAGKPLIARSIDEALASKYVDEVIVSTDFRDIADSAKELGAGVPFMRPGHLGGDDVPSYDVIMHAVGAMLEKDPSYGYVVQLHPTCPLRTAVDIDGAMDVMRSSPAKAVISVAKAEKSPLWMNTLPEDLNMADFQSDRLKRTPRQQLPVFYQLNGAIFAGDIVYLKERGSFYGPDTYAYIMPKERSVDIDDIFDFQIAETIYNMGQS